MCLSRTRYIQGIPVLEKHLHPIPMKLSVNGHRPIIRIAAAAGPASQAADPDADPAHQTHRSEGTHQAVLGDQAEAVQDRGEGIHQARERSLEVGHHRSQDRAADPAGGSHLARGVGPVEGILDQGPGRPAEGSPVARGVRAYPQAWARDEGRGQGARA